MDHDRYPIILVIYFYYLFKTVSVCQTCVISLWQFHDEIMGTGQFGGPVHVLLGGIRAAILDVFPHRASK